MTDIHILAEIPEIKVLLELIRITDVETYRHSLSVAQVTQKILMKTSYDEEMKDEILKGALLHDIGKIFVPFRLTSSPLVLSREEYAIVKSHAALSYEIVAHVFSKTVQNICLYHHERPNGTGYTYGLPLRDIPTEALLVQVADVYDALTASRPYKTPFTKEQALVEMHKEARDYKLDDGYLRILEEALKAEA